MPPIQINLDIYGSPWSVSSQKSEICLDNKGKLFYLQPNVSASPAHSNSHHFPVFSSIIFQCALICADSARCGPGGGGGGGEFRLFSDRGRPTHMGDLNGSIGRAGERFIGCSFCGD